MLKWIKRLLIFFGIVLASLLILTFIFISPIVKYGIEKYDKQFTNREITIDKLWLNILTGTFHIANLTVYEENGKDKFVTVADINIKLITRKALLGEYDITQASFKTITANIIVDGTKFNFDDILKKFSSTDSVPEKEKTEAVKYWLRNLTIENSTITTLNKKIGNSNEINNLKLSNQLIAWDKPDMLFDFGCSFKSGGDVKGQFKTNINSLAYDLNIDVQKFDLHAWYPYLKDIMNTKALDGSITTNLNIKGNFNTPDAIAAKGRFNISNLAILDPNSVKLIACKSFDVGIDSVNVQKGLYNLSKISFNSPFLLFDMYDNGNNFTRLFNDTTVSTTEAVAASAEDANVFSMIVGYVQDITKNYVVTNYNSDVVIIENGRVIFNDYTLTETYRIDLSEMEMNAKNLRSTSERIKMQAFSNMNTSGKAVIDFGVNPQDFGDFDLNIGVKELRVSDFNPYMVYYVAFPFLDGIIEYNTNTTVKNHYLKSSNNFVMLNAKLGKKANDKPQYSLPMKLAVSLLKDNKGNINLDIPIEGDLSDPKYKIGKIIWQVIKNLLIKAVTAPFKLLANLFGGKEEEMKEIDFEYRQTEMLQEQVKRLNKIVDILNKKPELNVELIQVNNTELEKEFQAVFEVKSQFYFLSKGIAFTDSIDLATTDSIKNVDLRDSAFVKYVNSKVTGVDALTPIQEKCRLIIGEAKLATSVKNRMEYRNSVVRDYLSVTKKVPLNRFRVLNTPDQKAANSQTVAKYLINFYADEDQPDAANKTTAEPKK
jgi:hypothetical protein